MLLISDAMPFAWRDCDAISNFVNFDNPLWSHLVWCSCSTFRYCSVSCSCRLYWGWKSMKFIISRILWWKHQSILFFFFFFFLTTASTIHYWSSISLYKLLNQWLSGAHIWNNVLLQGVPSHNWHKRCLKLHFIWNTINPSDAGDSEKMSISCLLILWLPRMSPVHHKTWYWLLQTCYLY